MCTLGLSTTGDQNTADAVDHGGIDESSFPTQTYDDRLAALFANVSHIPWWRSITYRISAGFGAALAHVDTAVDYTTAFDEYPLGHRTDGEIRVGDRLTLLDASERLTIANIITDTFVADWHRRADEGIRLVMYVHPRQTELPIGHPDPSHYLETGHIATVMAARAIVGFDNSAPVRVTDPVTGLPSNMSDIVHVVGPTGHTMIMEPAFGSPNVDTRWRDDFKGFNIEFNTSADLLVWALNDQTGLTDGQDPGTRRRPLTEDGTLVDNQNGIGIHPSTWRHHFHWIGTQSTQSDFVGLGPTDTNSIFHQDNMDERERETWLIEALLDYQLNFGVNAEGYQLFTTDQITRITRAWRRRLSGRLARTARASRASRVRR